MTPRDGLRPISPVDRPEVVFYAAGGGIGHLVRTVAVARRLQSRHRLACSVVTNSPFHEIARQEGVGVVHVAVPAGDTHQAVRAFVHALEGCRGRCLVMDTFPYGIVGELLGWLDRQAVRKVLIARARRDVTLRELQRLCGVFDAILLPEAPAGAAPTSCAGIVSVGPILIREPGELPCRDRARRRLGLETPWAVLVAHQGYAREVRPLFRLVEKVRRRIGRQGWTFRYATLHPPPWGLPGEVVLRHFPLVECMPAFDVVVGAAGCNLFHEVRALGLPAVFLPRMRRYDDQASRAAGWGRVASSPEDLERALAQVMTAVEEGEEAAAGCGKGAAVPPPPGGGADAAADRIAALLNAAQGPG